MNYNIIIYLTTNDDNISYTVKDTDKEKVVFELTNCIKNEQVPILNVEKGFVMINPRIIKFVKIERINE